MGNCGGCVVVPGEPFNILLKQASSHSQIIALAMRLAPSKIEDIISFVAKILLHRDSAARCARAIDFSRRANIGSPNHNI
jgi:hypothetical protein